MKRTPPLCRLALGLAAIAGLTACETRPPVAVYTKYFVATATPESQAPMVLAASLEAQSSYTSGPRYNAAGGIIPEAAPEQATRTQGLGEVRR